LDNTKNEVYIPGKPVEPDLDIVDRDRFDQVEAVYSVDALQKVFSRKNIAFIKSHLPAKGAMTSEGIPDDLNTADTEFRGFGLRDQILFSTASCKQGSGRSSSVCAVTVSPTIKVSAKIPKNFI